MVDLGQRQLLAQPVALSARSVVEVDRLRIEERLVQAVELLLNRLGAPLALRVRLTVASARRCHRREDAVLDQPHVARSRLQQREFVDEQRLQASALPTFTARHCRWQW